jgi:CheY-like chemotaxis protein
MALTKTMPHFIVIDDDRVNNIICTKLLQYLIPESEIKAFTDPAAGIAHILSTYTNTGAHPAILLLDIDMPAISGWDVMEQLGKFADKLRGNLRVFMLTSSVHPADRKKAEIDSLVSALITKPLSHDKLSLYFPDLMTN